MVLVFLWKILKRIFRSSAVKGFFKGILTAIVFVFVFFTSLFVIYWCSYTEKGRSFFNKINKKKSSKIIDNE
jgi:hypothetical protein